MGLKYFLLCLLISLQIFAFSQTQIQNTFEKKKIEQSSNAMYKKMPEHGFLPGMQFPIYSTIDSFDFLQYRIKVVLIDDRENRKLKQVMCSKIELTNTSELNEQLGTEKVRDYFFDQILLLTPPLLIFWK
jgi:hypothetical protein